MMTTPLTLFLLLLGGLFIGSGYNLWLPIFTPGCIDTAGILFMAAGRDERLKIVVWGKEAHQKNHN